MKMFLNNFVALAVMIFAVFSFSSLLVQDVSGQTSGTMPSLPSLLPVGSRPIVLDSITTNACYPAFDISYYDSTNGYHDYYRIPWGTVKFDSYASFETSMATNGWWLYTNYVANKTDVSSQVRFYATCYDPNIPNSGLIVSTNIGLRGQISMNSFRNLSPSIIRSSLAIPGLTQFTIEVDSNPPYYYTWPSPGQTNTSYPKEYTTAQAAVFNYWYAVTTNRVRFTINTSGKTMTYTQSGSSITAPSLVMSSDSRLDISMAQGSDTTIEATTDFESWLPIATFYSSLNSKTVSMTIDSSAYPMRFFRAKSQ